MGTNTVIKDNPTLNVRDWTGQNPVRIVLYRNNLLSDQYAIFNTDAETITFKDHTIKAICDHLHKENINSIIIEGGSKTLQLFIDANLWDEARVFSGKIKFIDGIKAPKFDGQLLKDTTILDDTLNIYTNKNR